MAGNWKNGRSRSFLTFASTFCTRTTPAFSREQATRRTTYTSASLTILFGKNGIDEGFSAIEAFVQLVEATSRAQAAALKTLLLCVDCSELSAETEQKAVWHLLNGFLLRDESPWPGDIPNDPDDPEWAYCLFGKRAFITALTPSHKKRHSRNIGSHMVLLFQLRDGIEFVAPYNVKGDEVRDTIRQRIEAYDDVPLAPDMTTHGEGATRTGPNIGWVMECRPIKVAALFIARSDRRRRRMMFSVKTDRQLTITTADWALVFIAMVWGSSYPAVKFVLSYSDVLLFIFIRFSLTALLMLPIFLARSRGGAWQTIRIGSFLGGLLFVIFWCETAGVQKTSAANAAFFISLCVLFTPLMEALIAKSLPSTRLILACGLTCVGAGMMGTNQDFQFQLNTGDLIILAAAFLRALGVVVTKHLTKDSPLDSGAITAIQMTMVALISGAWLFSTKSSVVLPKNHSFWLATLYLVLFCTLLAFYLQTHMVRLTSPTRVTLIMGTEPIFGAFFAIALLKEQLTYLQVMGGILIVFSTYLGMQAHNRSYRSVNHEQTRQRKNSQPRTTIV